MPPITDEVGVGRNGLFPHGDGRWTRTMRRRTVPAVLRQVPQLATLLSSGTQRSRWTGLFTLQNGKPSR